MLAWYIDRVRSWALTYQKTAPWGARLVAPAGAAFIAGGIAVGAATFVAPM